MSDKKEISWFNDVDDLLKILQRRGLAWCIHQLALADKILNGQPSNTKKDERHKP